MFRSGDISLLFSFSFESLWERHCQHGKSHKNTKTANAIGYECSEQHIKITGHYISSESIFLPSFYLLFSRWELRDKMCVTKNKKYETKSNLNWNSIENYSSKNRFSVFIFPTMPIFISLVDLFAIPFSFVQLHRFSCFAFSSMKIYGSCSIIIFFFLWSHKQQEEEVKVSKRRHYLLPPNTLKSGHDIVLSMQTIKLNAHGIVHLIRIWACKRANNRMCALSRIYKIPHHVKHVSFCGILR